MIRDNHPMARKYSAPFINEILVPTIRRHVTMLCCDKLIQNFHLLMAPYETSFQWMMNNYLL